MFKTVGLRQQRPSHSRNRRLPPARQKDRSGSSPREPLPNNGLAPRRLKGESTGVDWPGLGGKHFFQLFAYA